VLVAEIESTSLRHANVPTTSELLRLTMLFALTDHTARVQQFLVRRSGASEQAAGVLSSSAEHIAGLVDTIVSTACPHLMVSRLSHAWETTKEIWPNMQDECERATGNHEPVSNAGAWPKELSLPGCPEKLKARLAKILSGL